MTALDNQRSPYFSSSSCWNPNAAPSDILDLSLNRADWQRLWLGTQSRPWRTLAIVAGDPRISTYEVANLLVALGLEHGESIGMADVRNVALNRVPAIIELADEVVASGERIVFAARTIAENLATIPLARSADCVLLCATLGSTPLALIEETVEQVGKERFLGSLLLNDTGDPEAVFALRRRRPRLEEAEP